MAIVKNGNLHAGALSEQNDLTGTTTVRAVVAGRPDATTIFGVLGIDTRRHGSMTVDAGKTLRYRYRVIIHPGDAKSADIAGMYRTWTK